MPTALEPVSALPWLALIFEPGMQPDRLDDSRRRCQRIERRAGVLEDHGDLLARTPAMSFSVRRHQPRSSFYTAMIRRRALHLTVRSISLEQIAGRWLEGCSFDHPGPEPYEARDRKGRDAFAAPLRPPRRAFPPRIGQVTPSTGRQNRASPPRIGSRCAGSRWSSRVRRRHFPPPRAGCSAVAHQVEAEDGEQDGQRGRGRDPEGRPGRK